MTRDATSKTIVLEEQAALSIKSGRGNFPVKALQKSLAVFNKNKNGFFIMTEGAKIDFGGHQNNMSSDSNGVD